MERRREGEKRSIERENDSEKREIKLRDELVVCLGAAHSPLDSKL